MPKAAAATDSSLYDTHPGVAMVQKWVAELKDQTGRSLEEWSALVKKQGPKDEKSRREWLKTKHKFGTNGAWWIAERVDGKGRGEDTPEAYLKAAGLYVQEQYAGPKEKLRKVYDEILRLGKSLGADVKACPCKTIVPLYRKHVFAQIKPTNRTRRDLGLAPKDLTPAGRLPRTGGHAKGDRLSHRIPITCLADIDDAVKRWLQAAY